MKSLAIACTLATLLACLGCVHVKPWERGTLARPDMAWEPDRLQGAHRTHIFFSKEASLPAGSAGGGGCGCN